MVVHQVLQGKFSITFHRLLNTMEGRKAVITQFIGEYHLIPPAVKPRDSNGCTYQMIKYQESQKKLFLLQKQACFSMKDLKNTYNSTMFFLFSIQFIGKRFNLKWKEVFVWKKIYIYSNIMITNKLYDDMMYTSLEDEKLITSLLSWYPHELKMSMKRKNMVCLQSQWTTTLNQIYYFKFMCCIYIDIFI